MVHFIDDKVCRRRQCRPYIVFPAHGIGGLQVDDGSPFAVHAYGTGKHPRHFHGLLLCSHHVEGIKHAFQITLHIGHPPEILFSLHLDGLHRLAA